MVLGLVWCNAVYADHNNSHFIIIDCEMKISSNEYKPTEDGYGELINSKFDKFPIRLKFNKSSIYARPSRIYLKNVHQHFYTDIDDLVEGAESVIKERNLKVQKINFIRHKVYNFLIDLSGREARIIFKNNTVLNGIIDEKSEFFQRKKDENIYIFIDRVDGYGSITLRKQSTPLLDQYFTTLTYSLEKKTYVDIQRFDFFGCELTNAKF